MKETIREQIKQILPYEVKDNELVLETHVDLFWKLVQRYHEQHCEVCPLNNTLKQ
jgi:hypothetical protein